MGAKRRSVTDGEVGLPCVEIPSRAGMRLFVPACNGSALLALVGGGAVPEVSRHIDKN
jgi:hypothetical protein